jgi:hypothetical protein
MARAAQSHRDRYDRDLLNRIEREQRSLPRLLDQHAGEETKALGDGPSPYPTTATGSLRRA